MASCCSSNNSSVAIGQGQAVAAAAAAVVGLDCRQFQLSFYLVAMIVLGLTGLVGNCISIFVLGREIRANPVVVLLLRSLAVADNFFVVMWSLHYAVRHVIVQRGLGNEPLWLYFRVYSFPFLYVGQTLTIWTMVVVAVHRLQLIKTNRIINVALDGLSAARLMTYRHVMAAVAILSVVYNLPRFFEIEVVNGGGNSTSQSLTWNRTWFGDHPIYKHVYVDVMYYVFMFVVPLFVLISVNIYIVAVYRAALKSGRVILRQSRGQDRQAVIGLMADAGTNRKSLTAVMEVNRSTSNVTLVHTATATGCGERRSGDMADDRLSESAIDGLRQTVAMATLSLPGECGTHSHQNASDSPISARKNYRNIADRADDHDVTFVMITVIVIFLVCQLPARVVQMVVDYHHKDSQDCGKAPFYLIHFSNVLELLNSSVNFFVYCVLYRRFRRIVCDSLLAVFPVLRRFASCWPNAAGSRMNVTVNLHQRVIRENEQKSDAERLADQGQGNCSRKRRAILVGQRRKEFSNKTIDSTSALTTEALELQEICASESLIESVVGCCDDYGDSKAQTSNDTSAPTSKVGNSMGSVNNYHDTFSGQRC